MGRPKSATGRTTATEPKSIFFNFYFHSRNNNLDRENKYFYVSRFLRLLLEKASEMVSYIYGLGWFPDPVLFGE